MLVMAMDVDPGSPLCMLLIGLTMADIEDVIAEGNGVAPAVNIMEVLSRVRMHKMPGAVQIVIGADHAAIEEQVRAAMPNMTIYDLGVTGEDDDARIAEIRAEHNAANPPNINGAKDTAAAAAIRSSVPGLN